MNLRLSLFQTLTIFALFAGQLGPGARAQASPADSAGAAIPKQIPPRRSSQIHDGFGINSDLPRDPHLPWNRWWWTRMFDAGVKWIRIGQYENSSDQTSWDWIERKRGVLEVPPQLDDYVDSLVDNGVDIQVQLLYGKSRYMAADLEGYDEQVRFDEELARLGLDLDGFGPEVVVLEEELARRRLTVRGFGLVRVR